MADKWSDIIANSKSGSSTTVDVSAWLGKATLDAYVQVLVSGMDERRLIVNSHLERIGAGAFGYDFGALDETDNSFTKSYQNLLYDHLPLSPIVQGSRHANRLTRSLVSSPSGIPLDHSSSSWQSRNGSQGCSHGYTITPAILECRTSDRTGIKCAVLLGNYSIRRGRS